MNRIIVGVVFYMANHLLQAASTGHVGTYLQPTENQRYVRVYHNNKPHCVEYFGNIPMKTVDIRSCRSSDLNSILYQAGCQLDDDVILADIGKYTEDQLVEHIKAKNNSSNEAFNKTTLLYTEITGRIKKLEIEHEKTERQVADFSSAISNLIKKLEQHKNGSSEALKISQARVTIVAAKDAKTIQMTMKIQELARLKAKKKDLEGELAKLFLSFKNTKYSYDVVRAELLENGISFADWQKLPLII